MARRRPRAPADPFPVGSHVRLAWGVGKVVATVVEDRGHIGVGGRRLIRVRIDQPMSEPVELEMPAEELEPAA